MMVHQTGREAGRGAGGGSSQMQTAGLQSTIDYRLPQAMGGEHRDNKQMTYIIELYTWNLYTVINQCYSDTFNLKMKIYIIVISLKMKTERYITGFYSGFKFYNQKKRNCTIY